LAAGRKKLRAFVVSATLIFMVVSAYHLYGLVNAPLLNSESAPEFICLDKSATAYQFVRILKEKKLIHSTKLFLWMIRSQGLAHHLKAGVYQIQPGETANQLLKRIVAGDVVTENFTIIAGTTQQRVAQDLAKAIYMDYHPEDWLAIKGNYASAEGLLLADTYQYRGGSRSQSLLAQANKNLMNYLTDSWTHRAANLPYQTPYELLVAASIIEKESAIAQERKLIAGVMVNRLKKNMPLQMDPTVIYALGSAYRGKLSHNDLKIDSPYNSYRYRGLPPTPIAMIGKEAIDAAAHPEMSNYLYFVAKGDGSHQFSETYEQQKKAINQYQRKDS